MKRFQVECKDLVLWLLGHFPNRTEPWLVDLEMHLPVKTSRSRTRTASTRCFYTTPSSLLRTPSEHCWFKGVPVHARSLMSLRSGDWRCLLSNKAMEPRLKSHLTRGQKLVHVRCEPIIMLQCPHFTASQR